MVQIAERTSILDQEANKMLLIERANHLWNRQAMFEWDMVDVSSCNWSGISDRDSIDAEGNGSRFNSPTWEDDGANDFTEPNPTSALQLPPYAEEFTYLPRQLLNTPSGKCPRCFKAGSGIFCTRCNLANATCKLQHAPASPDTLAPTVHSTMDRSVQLRASQMKVDESRYLCLPYHTDGQYMQHSSCLSCGVTAMWPGALFCLECTLQSDPIENLFDASHTTSSAGDYIESPTGVVVAKDFAPLCYRGEMSDLPLVRADKATEDPKQDLVPRHCSVHYVLECVYGLHVEGECNATGGCVRKPKNPLV